MSRYTIQIDALLEDEFDSPREAELAAEHAIDDLSFDIHRCKITVTAVGDPSPSVTAADESAFTRRIRGSLDRAQAVREQGDTERRLK